MTRMVASNPADAMIGAAPMLPSTSAAGQRGRDHREGAAAVGIGAPPRDLDEEGRQDEPRPAAREGARQRSGRASTAAARAGRSRRPVSEQPGQTSQARLDPIGQPARWDAEGQHGDPVGDEEQPDVGARQLRALREVGGHDAPVGHVEQRDDERRRPLPAEREAEPSRRERGARSGRPVPAARMSASGCSGSTAGRKPDRARRRAPGPRRRRSR